MFNCIIMAGSGAITYLIARKGSDGNDERWYAAIIEYIMYVMFDMIVVYYCMMPLGRIEIVHDKAGGMAQINYGDTAILFSILTAVIMGFVFIAVKKKIDIGIEIKSR